MTYFIEVTKDNGDEFGFVAMVEKHDSNGDTYDVPAITRDEKKTYYFQDMSEATQAMRTFTRNTMCDHFDFNLVSVC